MPFTPARREQIEEHANLTRIDDLAPRLADVVAGRVEPAAGDADLLRFARLAAYEGNLLASSDLFQKAFAAASQPLERVGHPLLISGVRQAILASDQPETSDDQRTEQRERALRWLAADLQRFRTRGTPGPLLNPDEVCQQLRLWQICPGLDPVRDPARRDELPNDERDRWAAFWDEVELIRQEARSIIASRKPLPRSPLTNETQTPPSPTAEKAADPPPPGN